VASAVMAATGTSRDRMRWVWVGGWVGGCVRVRVRVRVRVGARVLVPNIFPALLVPTPPSLPIRPSPRLSRELYVETG
jgi:hypothetical protein